MSSPIVLKVCRGQRLISVKQFTTPQIVIGRQPDASLSLDDESVAPLHAVIEKREDGYYISDLGAPTGVTIETQKILESEIHSGEAIGIGPYSIRFYIGVPKPSVAPDYQKAHVPPFVPREEKPAQAETPEQKPVVESSVVEEKVEEKKAPAVQIKSQKIEETLKKQRIEPSSSGYVAPLSDYESVEEIVNPYSRGSVLEIIFAWRERIVSTYHFSNKQTIHLSNSEKADVYVPLSGTPFKHKFVTFSDECIIHISNTMSGEIFSDGKKLSLEDYASNPLFAASGSGSQLKLDQGQMLKLNFMNGQVALYVRYVEDAPVATKAPVFDFTTPELLGVVMSGATIFALALYMMFYVPGSLADTDPLLEDRLKRAVITFNPPPRRSKPLPPKTKTKPPKLKKPRVTKVAEKASKPIQPKPQLKKGTTNPKGPKVSDKPGKVQAAAPSRVKTTKKVGSSRPGGSVKTGAKAANTSSKKVDVTKTGILGVLSGGGVQEKVDKAYSGAGTTIGVAGDKTGKQGQLSDHKGTGIGTKLQTPGQGGKGSALAGVGGVKTSGRGGGDGSYGEAGLGGKGSYTIANVDLSGSGFSSTIDKEAIRRLIRRNRKSLEGCYNTALAKNSSLSGTVTLSWKIIYGGKMIEPKVVRSSLNNSKVENCIIRRLRALTFPSPQQNEIAEVSEYPFVFKTKR